MPSRCHALHRLRVLVLLLAGMHTGGSPLVAAEDGQPAQQGSERRTGDHRYGVRVQIELVPEAVRAVFVHHGGAELTALIRRTDASGRVAYLARIIDLDQSTQILVVSVLGEILYKGPPRRHAMWQPVPGNAWASEGDASLWSVQVLDEGSAFTAEAKPEDTSLWGSGPSTEQRTTLRMGLAGDLAAGALNREHP